MANNLRLYWLYPCGCVVQPQRDEQTSGWVRARKLKKLEHAMLRNELIEMSKKYFMQF
jgi:hypothetical protein